MVVGCCNVNNVVVRGRPTLSEAATSNLEKHDFNEHLIDEVKKENTIWDMSSPHYKSQLLKEVAWRRIATAMGCNGE